MTKIKSKMLKILLAFLCFQITFFANGGRDFEAKVALLTTVEQEDPKCFAEGMVDLTCFWEEDGHGAPGQYTFVYKYQNENSSTCTVASQPAGGGRTRYFCKLSEVKHFVSLDLQVFRNGEPLHNRCLSIDLVFLLDPPANLTVTRTGKKGQLKLRWLPPSLKYMADSMMYEVSYALTGSRMGKMEVVRGNTEFILRGLRAGTRYEVWVRAKPNGLTYNGYWSAWTPSVSMETPPSDLDPLVIGLCLIVSLILTLLALTAFVSQRRFLWKMWPLIPSPENQFPGLFTVYGGDFLEWLGQSNGWLQLMPNLLYQEAISGPLEVLSEAKNGPLPGGLILPSKASHLMWAVSEEEHEEEEDERGKPGSGSMERWKTSSHECWLTEQIQALHTQPIASPWPSLLPSQDAYVTVDQNPRPKGRDGRSLRPSVPDDLSEELHVLFTAPGTSESCSDLGSLQQGLGPSRLSSLSGLEYPQNNWLPKGPGYPYLAVADSGVSMDYSPMSSSVTGSRGAGIIYAHEYKNGIPQHKQHSSGEPIAHPT